MAVDSFRKIEQSGTRISKEKLIEAVKNLREKEFQFLRDGGFMIVKVPLQK